jgi:hypothetical protein
MAQRSRKVCLRSSDADEVASAFLEAALFAETDNADDSGGEPLDRNYSVSDFASATRRKLEKKAKQFYCQNKELIDSAEGKFRSSNTEQAGYDLWLTAQGHGAGFWDGDWPEATGKKLTAAAEKVGQTDLYVANGKIYGS